MLRATSPTRKPRLNSQFLPELHPVGLLWPRQWNSGEPASSCWAPRDQQFQEVHPGDMTPQDFTSSGRSTGQETPPASRRRYEALSRKAEGSLGGQLSQWKAWPWSQSGPSPGPTFCGLYHQSWEPELAAAACTALHPLHRCGIWSACTRACVLGSELSPLLARREALEGPAKTSEESILNTMLRAPGDPHRQASGPNTAQLFTNSLSNHRNRMDHSPSPAHDHQHTGHKRQATHSKTQTGAGGHKARLNSSGEKYIDFMLSNIVYTLIFPAKLELFLRRCYAAL